MSLNHLYEQLLDHKAELRPELQHRIFDHARRYKRWDLLRGLAGHPGLDPDVDARIRDIDELSVIVAWATRPGRDPEELASRLLGEKRVSALLALATQPGLPADVYRTIAKVKSAKLAEVLAGNQSAPLDIRIDKLRAFVTKSPRGRYQRHGLHLQTLCSAEDENDVEALYRTVLEHSLVAPYLVTGFQQPHVTSKDIERLIENLLVIDAYDDRTWRGHIPELVRAAIAKCTADQRQRLLAKTCEILENGSKTSYRDWTLNSIKTMYDELTAIGNDVLDALEAVERSATPEEFTATYEQALSVVVPSERHQLAQVVTRHPHADLDQIVGEIRWLRSTQDLRTTVRLLEARGRLDIVLAIVETQPVDARYIPSVLLCLEDTESGVEHLVERFTADGRTLPNWVAATDLFNRRPDLALSSLRWEALCHTAATFPQVADLVQSELLDALGDSAGAWEAIGTIGESFDGTFSDLLVVAKELG